MDASIKTIVSVRVPPVVFRYADSRKLNDLSQSSAVSVPVLLKQLENAIVRRFISPKIRSKAFRFPCFSHLKSEP
jgi:hypothetical protein